MNLRERLAAVEAELRTIHETAGDAALSDETQTRWDELTRERGELNAAITRDDERRALVRSLAERPGHTEPGDGARGGAPEVMLKADASAILANPHRASRQALVSANLRAVEGRIEERDNQVQFERILKRHAGDTAWAANLLGRAQPEYVSGWAKMMTGREMLLTGEERAAMAVGTNTAGGFLVPTFLDPSLILTSAGSSDDIRQIARVVTLTTGNVWNGVSTAGVTASYDGELTEVSDDTPAFAKPSISIFKGQAFVQASIEAFEDIDNLASDVLMLIADARDTIDGSMHAVGTGSGQPEGVFHAVNASSSRQVVSTTAAAIGLVDIQATYKKVGQRWRKKSTWCMNPTYLLAIQTLGTALSASYTTNLSQPLTEDIIGRPVLDTDDAPTTQTTTVLDQEVLFGDFSNYVLVDKPGSTSVEFVPLLTNTANNLPDGRRGWYAHWRHGAGVPNLAAFALLVDKTSA
jgi:HK97 family phage major capsid protein